MEKHWKWLAALVVEICYQQSEKRDNNQEDNRIKLLFHQRARWELRLIIFASLAITLLFLDMHGIYVARARSSLAYFVTPLQHIVSRPIQWLFDAQTKMASHAQLRAENANLRTQQLLLRARVQKLVALEQENRQLRVLLQSSNQFTTEKVQVAQLLAVHVDRFQQQIIVDQGKQAGIYKGQPVLDPYGVLGQVERVLPLSSQVLLITDPRSAIPVEVARNGLRAVAVGLGAVQQLSLENLPKTADIREGDVIVTSGLGGRYPAGYPVGVVQKALRDSGEQFAQITIMPSAHLNRSRLVMLIGGKEQNNA